MARNPKIPVSETAPMAGDDARVRRAGMPVALAIVVGSVAVAAGLVVRFPNLRGAPGYLALAVLTPLLAGALLSLLVSAPRRRTPRVVVFALGGALAAALALDLAFFVAVGFIQTTAHDAVPAFASQPTAQPTVPASQPTATAPAQPVVRSGHFDHRAGVETVSGDAYLGATSGGAFVLRLQDLQSAHGPDLYVYLSPSASPATPDQVMGGLEVAPLRATAGDQNYALPAGIDPSQYKSVVIYCKSFSAIFGYANLG